MPRTIMAAAAALLISGSLTLAQPPGITPEMINRSLPLEGAPLAVPGPYKVTSEGAFGSLGLHVYRPAALEAFPKKDSLPVMVWGNGGCAMATLPLISSTAAAARMVLGMSLLHETVYRERLRVFLK